MPLYEIFSHSDRFHYRTRLFSLATCFLILCTALTFLPPFLFAYFAGGFWTKEAVYNEHPRVNYSCKYILTITDAGATTQFFSSYYASLNTAFQNVLIPAPCTFAVMDTNNDNVADRISLEIDLLFGSTAASVSINNINLWIILGYELRAKQRIVMESMALINLFSSDAIILANNPKVTTVGDLVFQQRKPIQSSGSNLDYNRSIIDINSLLSASSLDLNPVLEEYFTRSFYTTYQSQYTKWTLAPTDGSNVLTVNVTLNIGSQSIRFIPGFWQEFKWGWIQYVCALLPFIVVFNRVKEFVFRNQLVRTLVEVPYHRHKA